MATLQQRLLDWTDIDLAAYELGAHMGLWREFGSKPNSDPWNGVKWVMWSNNPVGNALYETIHAMIDQQVLDATEDKDQVRWHPDFKKL